MTNAYVDSSPTGLLPVDATTVWNYSSPRPSGADHVNLSWTPPSTNESGFYICSASDARMIYDLNCESVVGSNPYTKENITWDPANSTITVANITAADNWIYWRVLSYQEIVQEKYFRFGEWSQVNTFRVPDDQGYDDGAGNHTVNLSSGSIFSETGLLHLQRPMYIQYPPHRTPIMEALRHLSWVQAHLEIMKFSLNLMCRKCHGQML